MPSKNTIRTFIKDGIYHIYDRGVEKRNIFLDEEDYKIFLYYLKVYLTPPNTENKKNKIPLNILRMGSEFDLYKNIKLLCYALMPNHFHFLVRQIPERAITEFMRRLTNAYVKYFNEKYQRVGPLFQGRYKAALVSEEKYLLRLSFYIHSNPLELAEYSDIETLENYPYFSYPDYIGKRRISWIDRDYILNYFGEEKKFTAYKELMQEFALTFKLKSNKYKTNLTELKPLLLEK